MMVELQFPMPVHSEGLDAAKRHLSDASKRLEDWLQTEFDGQFEISSSALASDFGGYWEKCISVHDNGRLHATFSLEWNAELAADEFTVACHRVAPPDPTAPARLAGSACVAAASAFWLNPLMGGIAFFASYLVLRSVRGTRLPSISSLGLNEAGLLRAAGAVQAA